MPTYDFRCPNGHDFEKFYRKISDAASELPCPECGATAQRRVSGGAGLVFKGSGFYLTDYGKDAHRKPAPGAPAKDDAATKDGKGAAATASTGDSTSGGASAAKGESTVSESKPAPSKGGAGPGGSGAE